MNFLRLPAQEDRLRVDKVLERVGLSELRTRQIGELSGGQKKRVFLARALAQQGVVLLLDEPFTGVDVKTENAIIDLLRALRDEGHLILVSTHNLGSVPEFCDQVTRLTARWLLLGRQQPPLPKAIWNKHLAVYYAISICLGRICMTITIRVPWPC